MQQESNQEPKLCFYCQKPYSTLLEFTKCKHKICITCLFQRIFINNIKDFKGENIIKVKCKCDEGELDQTLGDISSIIMQKIEFDEINKKENQNEDQKEKEICKYHNNKYLNYYCIECFTHICKSCQSESTNEHHSHRVLHCRKLKKIIKGNIEKNLFLKFNDKTFKILCDQLANKIQGQIEKNLNETLETIDSMIKCMYELRDEYVKIYKEQLKPIIQTFKIIKIYYMNYYNDRNLAIDNKCNNINFLRYVNNIGNEFVDVDLKHNEEIKQKYNEFNKLLNQVKKREIKLVKSNFEFNDTSRTYMIDQIITNAHNSYITGLVELNDESILTSCRKELLMKIYKEDEEGNEFKEKIQIKGDCGCLLYLEDQNKIISGGKDGVISIYVENDKKQNKYEKVQTLSHHNGPINSLARILDNKIVSGGSDCRIIIWEQPEHNKDFTPLQIIKIDNPIAVIISLFDSRIVFTCDDGPIYIYKVNDSFENQQQELCEYIENEVLNIIDNNNPKNSNKIHRGRVSCLCQLNNGYLVSGGADKLEKTEGEKVPMEHYLVIWRIEKEKYIHSQTLKEHKGNLTCIIQLRNGNFASSSYDHTIKIWKPKLEKEIEKYELFYDITEYIHGIHKIIQLKDDRLCCTSSKNQIVIWRNRSGSY